MELALVILSVLGAIISTACAIYVAMLADEVREERINRAMQKAAPRHLRRAR